MSAESPAVSRPPQTNSANADSGPEKEVSESRSGKTLDELPSPEEKVQEFLDEFGAQAHVPLSTEHGRELRPECFEEETEVREYVTEEGETERVEDVIERSSVPLWQGVANMLEWHVDYHKSTLRLEYGEKTDPTHTLLDVDLDNSWFAEYQDTERAKLKALERQTCGYQTCEECETRYCTEIDEHETGYIEGSFEEPVVALTGRTASGAGRPPVDHAREIADAWSSGGVRRSLRYVTDKLGLSGGDWVRWSQGEPHPGDGENQGYHHEHDIIILDAAAAEGEITAETFRPVIESHVETCEHAGPEAHDLDKSREQWKDGEVDTVSVKYVDEEIEESVASYAAAYLANEQKDLLERPPEYLAWAATMWATNTQKGIKSDSANHAIAADRCRHKHHDGEQDTGHGEQVTYSNSRGYKVECLMCGSPWDIEQKETLVAAKRVAGPDVAVTDGGATAGEESAEQSAEEELRERWPNAKEVARIGGPTVERECDHSEPDTCPLCATETESPNHTVSGEVPIPESATAKREVETVSVGFERPPKWKAKSIIRDGEEIPATGGTTDKKPLDLPSAPSRVVSMAAKVGARVVCEECGQWCESLQSVASHECEADLYVGWLPATEAPAAETSIDRETFIEAVPERLLSEESAPTEEEPEPEPEPAIPKERIQMFVEDRPDVSVAGVLGEFGLPPDLYSEVSELVESV